MTENCFTGNSGESNREVGDLIRYYEQIAREEDRAALEKICKDENSQDTFERLDSVATRVVAKVGGRR